MRWPTPDWALAPGLYKALKYLATRPVKSVCRVHAQGLRHVPREGGLLVAVNHWSYWDPVLVADVLPRPLVHLAKSGLFKTRATRFVFEDLVGQIPVHRERGGNEEAVRRSVEAVRAGRVVAIYPEGTRSLPPALLPGRTGVARIALESGAPILPIACASDAFWPKTRAVPKFGARVYVNIGEPIRLPRDPDGALDRERTRKVTDDVMGRIRALLDEALSARSRDEDWPWVPENGRLLPGRRGSDVRP